MAQSAVLLPARLETRFDEVDGVSRMRVIVVPDRCWFDRHHGATQREIEMLDTAVRDAGGALFAGQAEAEGPNAASAFAALAGGVGPARALWLARTFPARRTGDAFDVDPGAGPRDDNPQRTAITGLPGRIDLVAETAGGRVHIDTLSPRGRLVLDPQRARQRSATAPDDGAEEWWPQWPELVRAGLATTITPSPVTPGEVLALYAFGLGEAHAADVLDRHLAAGDLGLLQVGQATNTVAGSPTVDLERDPESWRALAIRDPDATERRLAHAVAGCCPPGTGAAGEHDDRIRRHARRRARGHAVPGPRRAHPRASTGPPRAGLSPSSATGRSTASDPTDLSRRSASADSPTACGPCRRGHGGRPTTPRRGPWITR